MRRSCGTRTVGYFRVTTTKVLRPCVRWKKTGRRHSISGTDAGALTESRRAGSLSETARDCGVNPRSRAKEPGMASAPFTGSAESGPGVPATETGREYRQDRPIQGSRVSSDGHRSAYVCGSMIDPTEHRYPPWPHEAAFGCCLDTSRSEGNWPD